MSEYQYYEFRTLDRQLTQAEMKRMRGISSRAAITSTSFVNHYEWGDFKGDPAQFMECYFDLFLYLSNWRTRRFSLRLPKRLVDVEALKSVMPDAQEASFWIAGENVIVDVFREEVDLGEWDDGDEEDGRGWLDSLAQLRADVLDGDLRVFYLAWLMAVETGVGGG